MSSSAEAVVLSHLRWSWVWQRPQHLISRLAAGRCVWFVEEPWPAPVGRPNLHVEEDGPVTRVWLNVPATIGDPTTPDAHLGFDAPGAEGYADLLADLLGPSADRLAWLYTPMALPLAEALAPQTLVYDVMDDLASFDRASEAVRLGQRQALKAADVVFTGGRSLHAGVRKLRPTRTFCFPSGVDPDHYAAARALRRPHERPVAGYVGVIDERLDLALVAGLAAALPDWEVRMVGPVAKIDMADLPQAPNLVFTGKVGYDQLPGVMAGFDVALMPFALNQATRSISPTKTLEYLAAGLPVVSTRVADVVADYASVVALADDAAGFAATCRAALEQDPAARAAAVAPLVERSTWDAIAERMEELIRQVSAGDDPKDAAAGQS